LNLVDDLFAHTGPVDWRQQMGQEQRLHPGAARNPGVVAVIAARGAILRRRFGAAEVVIHVNQHVATRGQLDERMVRCLRIAERSRNAYFLTS
jgi:hypothetical protein